MPDSAHPCKNCGCNANWDDYNGYAAMFCRGGCGYQTNWFKVSNDDEDAPRKAYDISYEAWKNNEQLPSERVKWFLDGKRVVDQYLLYHHNKLREQERHKITGEGKCEKEFVGYTMRNGIEFAEFKCRLNSDHPHTYENAKMFRKFIESIDVIKPISVPSGNVFYLEFR